MKIRKLIFSNINCLYGTTTIDFDAPEYQTSGVFSITGKTGSGKTTIFDAICLGLYGKTPRTNANNSGTNMASIGSVGEVMAEVTFSIGEDKYVSKYTMNPEREKSSNMTLHKNEKLLSDGLRNVKDKIKNITNMTFEQFCRVVMLAQGAFDSFLTADEADKAAILENITGTEIYSKIEDAIKKRYNDENDAYERASDRVKDIKVLPQEEIDEISAEIANIIKENNLRNQNIKNLAEYLNLFKNKSELVQKQEKNREEQEKLQKEISDFQPSLERLLNADKAASVSNEVESFQKSDEELRKLNENIRSTEENAETVADSMEEYKNAKSAAEKEHSNLQTVLDKKRSIMSETDKIDGEITSLKKQISDLERKIDDENKRTEEINTALFRIKADKKKLAENNEQWKSYLETHARDAELEPKISGWEEIIKNIAGKTENIETKDKDLKELNKQITAAEKKLESANTSRKSTAGALEKKEKEITDFDKELDDFLNGDTEETLKHNLDVADAALQLARAIAGIKELGHLLKPGEPCPLCGSCEHPNPVFPVESTQKVVYDKAKDRLDEFGKHKLKLEALNGEVKAAKDALNLAENSFTAAEEKVDILRKQRTGISDELKDLQESAADSKYKLQKELDVYGFKLEPEAGKLPDEIRKRIEEYKNCTNKSNDFQKEDSRLETEIQKKITSLEENTRQKTVNNQELQELQGKKQEASKKRSQLFGDKDTKQEREKDEKDRKEAEEKLSKASENLARVETQRKKLLDDLEKMKKERENKAPKTESLRKIMDDCLAEKDLSLELYQKYLMPTEEANSLRERKLKLKNNEETLKNGEANLAKELSDVQKKLPDMTEDTVLSNVKTLEKNREAAYKRQGALNEQLENNKKLTEKYDKQKKELDEQEHSRDLWKRLFSLTATGNRFKRFAQGLTLEQLLDFANAELKQMNPRYSLVLKIPENGREYLGQIYVSDKSQGGIERTVANLSGGERFQVSLALSLGLRRMQGEKIQVDSMFLDEGFGTLDTESQIAAMQTLSRLKNDGKLVGVISHIQAVSENIPVNISAIPQGGGRSLLIGPGITHTDTSGASGKKRKKKEKTQ